MPMSAGQSQFRMTFEISAVTLSGGAASGLFGGLLPLLSAMGGADAGLDDAFGYFRPLPNTALILQQYGKFPYANLAIAANSAIRDVLPISLLMVCPVRDAGGYAKKLSIITSLKNTLQNHIDQGGTFNVATPFFFFNDLLLDAVHDVTGEGNQPQAMWKWDFEKPLISIADAQAAQSQMMSRVSGGLPTGGEESGFNAAGPSSAAAPQGSPVAAATPSAGIPSFTYSNPSTSYQLPGGNSYVGQSPFAI